jgi:hypothetical protein
VEAGGRWGRRREKERLGEGEKGGIFPRNALVRDGFLILRLPLRQLLEPVGAPPPHFALVGWDGEADGVSLRP